MNKIAIFTIKDDLHALVIQQEILSRGGCCQVIEADVLWQKKIHIGFNSESFQLPDRDNKPVKINELDVIWWRRSVREQRYVDEVPPEDERRYMNNEFEATVFGVVNAVFKGRWISKPFQTTLASNKIIQTNLALQLGFSVPETIVSQDPEQVYEFITSNSFEVILKPLYGSTKLPVYTNKINKAELPSKESISVCPTIYQECVPGNIHYRVNVFGETILPFKITTDDLDWRQDMNNPVEYCELQKDTEERMIAMLKKLNLEMGIFDFKVHGSTGKLCFFEVNPQGNFLFLEGLTGFDLTGKMADFLMNTKD